MAHLGQVTSVVRWWPITVDIRLDWDLAGLGKGSPSGDLRLKLQFIGWRRSFRPIFRTPADYLSVNGFAEAGIKWQ
jgi:hypothetical protein